MKNNHFFILACMMVVNFTFSAYAEEIPLLTPKETIKTIQVGNRTYTIPSSIKLIQLPNGHYSIEKDDILDHRVGNGGDYIRSTYIQIGRKVLDYLTSTDAGAAVVAQNGLNLAELELSLDISRVVLTNEILFDNTGSVVDAIGVPGLVILSAGNWLDHFEKERNVYHLVFHEMLRSASVNDDNYVISQALLDFPSTLRLSTRLLPLIPMIEEDSIAKLVGLDSISTGGTGCPKKDGNYADLDLTKNVIELTLGNFLTVNDENRKIDRKACSLAVPVQLPANKRLTISLIDLQGQVHSDLVTGKATNTITFEAFLAGGQNPKNKKVIQLSAGDKSFLFRKTDVLTSGCGTSEILRLNVGNLLTTASESNVASKSTSQIKKIAVYLSLESCN